MGGEYNGKKGGATVHRQDDERQVAGTQIEIAHNSISLLLFAAMQVSTDGINCLDADFVKSTDLPLTCFFSLAIRLDAVAIPHDP